MFEVIGFGEGGVVDVEGFLGDEIGDILIDLGRGIGRHDGGDGTWRRRKCRSLLARTT